MASSNTISIPDFTQERLAIFVVNKDTSQPWRKVPIFAELVVSNEAHVTRDKDTYISPELATALDASPLSEKLSNQARLKKLTESAIAEIVDWSSLSEEDHLQRKFNSFIDAVIFQYQSRNWLEVSNSQVATITDVRGVVSFVAKRSTIYDWAASRDPDLNIRTETTALGVLAAVMKPILVVV
ncbi:MAG: hypothetical protein Q9192_003406 [Flavoplaca navasiana]